MLITQLEAQYRARNLVVAFSYIDVLEKPSGHWRMLRRVASGKGTPRYYLSSMA